LTYGGTPRSSQSIEGRVAARTLGRSGLPSWTEVGAGVRYGAVARESVATNRPSAQHPDRDGVRRFRHRPFRDHIQDRALQAQEQGGHASSRLLRSPWGWAARGWSVKASANTGAGCGSGWRHRPRPLRLRRHPPARRQLRGILAAYGGIFVAGSLAWGVVVDGFKPDRYDLAGAATASSGWP